MLAVFSPLLAVPLIFLLLPASPAKAEDACGKHLAGTCTGCHSLVAPCERLGSPANEWMPILKQMRVNGAELSSREVEALSVCLSQVSATAKAACGK